MPSPSRPDPARRRAVRLVRAAVLVAAAACGASTGEPVRVMIPPGASLAAAASRLERAEVIDHPRLFRLYAMVTRRDRELKPGTYRFRPGQSYDALLAALTEGDRLEHVVIIPEGFALSQIVPRLARTLEVPEDSVAAAVRDTALLRRLGVPTRTLEGYLFPATYTFPVGTSARAAVRAMVQKFEQEWDPAWDERLRELGMTRHELLSLAAIVEKEAKIAEERPLIAAVYHNRLRDGMLLQADPTVQYARGSHTARVLYKDLRIDSRYNTYRYPGLPPGPIASPGRASIEASLFPARVPYKFFVAYPDGHHEFRTTFEAHTKAVAEARRLRARQAASEARATRR